VDWCRLNFLLRNKSVGNDFSDKKFKLIKAHVFKGFSPCSNQLFWSEMSSFSCFSASFSESDCKDSASSRNIKF